MFWTIKLYIKKYLVSMAVFKVLIAQDLC